MPLPFPLLWLILSPLHFGDLLLIKRWIPLLISSRTTSVFPPVNSANQVQTVTIIANQPVLVLVLVVKMKMVAIPQSYASIAERHSNIIVLSEEAAALVSAANPTSNSPTTPKSRSSPPRALPPRAI